jgi:D-sedoheptulose 7-phosphate isomerase
MSNTVRTTFRSRLRADGAQLVRSRISDSVAAKAALLEGEMPHRVAALAQVVARVIRSGGKVLLFGNGGSAADATHLAAEFVGRFRLERPALPALSLTDNASSLSAIGNDYAYEEVFARQIAGLGRPGDIAIGLSTSGTSANVVAGLSVARQLDMHTAAFTGSSGGALSDEAEVCLCMPTDDTARVQECYMLVGHTVCELVEQELFAQP